MRMTLHAFLRREDGVATILGVLLFVMMVFAGGLAIDVMRVEVERAKLQYTLDRAVLAAASLTQAADREAVVRDYLRAAGLSDHPVEISVGALDDDASSRVAASTAAPVRSLFAHLLGVDDMIAHASSVAEERIRKIEMSVVLDMSSSMRHPSDTPGLNRVQALKPPAKRFISDILGERPGEVSISVVPFHNHVWMGATMERYFPTKRDHHFSYCARFSEAAYRETAVPDGVPLEQVAHYSGRAPHFPDPDGGARDQHGTIHRFVDFAGAIPDGPKQQNEALHAICRSAGAAPILFSNDEARLHEMIDALDYQNGTALDLGTKWGVTLLDPSTRPRVQRMSADGVVDPRFAARPADYDDNDTIKILVVMSDGETDHQEDIYTHLKSGPSGVYAYHEDFPTMSAFDRLAHILTDPGGHDTTPPHKDRVEDPSELTFSFRDRNDPTKFYQSGVKYRRHFDIDGNYISYGIAARSEPVGGSHAVELDFAHLWALKPLHYIRFHMVRWFPYNSGMEFFNSPGSEYFSPDPEDGVPLSTDNLQAICDAAKAKGIRVFTMGYLVEEKGAQQLRDCASRPADFHLVSDDLQGAFDDITRVVTQLRLAQ